MPIVTAAVIAVGAAIATTTVATVATAAVAVGTLVGTIGLGMSVVGAITKNKTLSKIGGYLGMAGGVMTLGGGLAGGFAGYAETLGQAWNDGLGSMFSETPAVGESALDSGALKDGLVKSAADNAVAQQAAPMQSASPEVAVNQVGDPFNPGKLEMVGPRPQYTTVPEGGAKYTDIASGTNPSGLSQEVVPGDMSKFANSAPQSAPTGTEPLAQTTAQANTAPNPTMNLDAMKQQTLSGIDASMKGLSPTSSVGSMFSNMPDWMKMQLAMTGAQGVAGALGSWFQSASAEKKLELEQQAQQWYQDYQNKNQKFSQGSASYAPKVTFGNGLINKGAAT